jgi:hypothetical protein
MTSKQWKLKTVHNFSGKASREQTTAVLRAPTSKHMPLPDILNLSEF